MKLSPFFKNKHNQAILALTAANIIWGAASPIFKLALENIPPFTLAFLRFFGATLLLLPFAIHNLHIEKRDWGKLILLSLFGITINITFFFFGLKRAPSINAPIIASSGPIFLYLLSLVILKEKFHPKLFAGTLMSLLGVLLIVGQPIIAGTLDGEFVGNLFFLLAMFGSVGYTIVSKEILPKYDVVTVTFWSFLLGSLTFLPFFFFEVRALHPFATLDYRGWTGLIFGIFFSSALAYLLFEWAVKKLETQEVGIFTYIDPIVAIIIAIPLLGETITPLFTFGSILVFLGIFLAEGRIHYHPLHKLKR